MHIKLQVVWDDVKSLCKASVRALKSLDYVLQCFVLYVAGTLLDNLSSLNFPPGIQEANPFSRHADGTFYLKNALITEGMLTLETLFVSAGLYIAGRIFGKKAGLFGAGLPFIYFGYLHLDAAFQNFLLEIPGLYIQTAQDILRHLLGN